MKKYELTDETIEMNGHTLHRIRALRNIERYAVKAGDLGGYIESEDNLSQKNDCWVFDDAQVYDYARVHGNAQVYNCAWVSDDARVYGNAQVYGNAWVYGNARVSGDAQVYGNAWVYGNARVSDYAWVYNYARVYDQAQVYGKAQVYGNARVSDYAWVYDYARVYGDVRVSGNTVLISGEWNTNPLYIMGSKWACNVAAPDKLRIGCRIHTHEEWRERWRDIAEENDAGDDLVREYAEYYNLAAWRMGWPEFLPEVSES